MRRVVSRCIAQMFSSHFHAACSPHQFALSTRAGTGAVLHALTTATQHNQNSTILSIDGIGAYDAISRNSMLQGLRDTPEANRCLPYVRLWYATESEYVWHDAQGQHHTVIQGEGGEQGDPLMPALFSLGQQPALRAVQAQLLPGETLYAYLDDIYVVVQPHRVRPVYDLLAHHLETHARIRLNQGKTRVWNRGGLQPPDTDTLGPETWVGNQNLPAEQQGLTVLGAPIGTEDYVQTFLHDTLRKHSPLLVQLPAIPDLQAAWLLLLYTASPRSNYLLRLLPPSQTAHFAQHHDLEVSRCLTRLLQMDTFPVDAIARAHLPLAMGGLGLMSATHLAAPAFWASWADAIPVLHRQTPAVADAILQLFTDPAQAPAHIQAAQAARQTIQEQGWEPPTWPQLREAQPPHSPAEFFCGADATRLAKASNSPFQLCSPGGAVQHPGPSKPSDA